MNGYPKELHHKGRLTGDKITEFSDSLLMFVARSRLPEMRERHHVEIKTDYPDIREAFLSRLEAMTERFALSDGEPENE